jgi:F-type H+-transporting ATPase subunit delta
MRPSTTARRYATAAFDVASSSGQTDRWLRDLQQARETYSRDIVRTYFEDPNVAGEEKLATLPRLFPGISDQVLNLLRVLTSRHRMHLLPPILVEFEHLVREARGVLEADVTVARPVTEAERQEILQRLRTLTGKEVQIQVGVDPAILGGVVVRIGDQVIDASVAGRLDRLRQDLAV